MFFCVISDWVVIYRRRSQSSIMYWLSDSSNVAEKHDNLLLSVAPSMLVPAAAMAGAAMMVSHPAARMMILATLIVGTIIVISFFRNAPIDKSRYEKLHPADMVSPADGQVLKIDRIPADQVARDYGPLVDVDVTSGTSSENLFTRIVIVLTVFDKHVQVMPCAALVDEVREKSGALLPILSGFDDLMKKTDKNERMVLSMRTHTGGHQFFVVLLAGLLASKIVLFDDFSSARPRGYKFGMIKFGSRVDLIVPPYYNIVVKPGQRVVLGETIMALAPEIE